MGTGCGQAKEPLLRKEGIGPALMVTTATSTPATMTPAQDTAQAHAEPGIERGKAVTRAALEVRKPPAQRAIHVHDDDRECLPVVARGFGPQGVLELLDALRARPVMALRAGVAQAVKAPASGVHVLRPSSTCCVRKASSSASTRPSATRSCTRCISAGCGMVSK